MRDMKIEPRDPNERGGYLMMPLERNVPGFGERHPAELVNCPKCGNECWKREGTEALCEQLEMMAVCADCGLRLGMARKEQEDA
jgi:hypothetical protein